ncbi:MAG TPA: class I SAM-dependent methyltransferase [Chloroflexota bacterium]|nr:class I SAM-dependent methyltransferase [Chloroflexota bacterium]
MSTNYATSNEFQQESERIEALWRPEIARLRIPSIGQSEAALLATFAAASSARRALELGTAIGYSAAYLAAGMGPSGQVTAVDLNPERARVARMLWTQAGLADRITLYEGDALQLTPSFGTGFDLVFVDLLWEIRENESGRQLARQVASALRPGGVLVADNCGQQIPAAEGLKAEIAAGSFRTTLLLPLGDGIFVAVKQ